MTDEPEKKWNWYVGKVFWINNELYAVTKIGEMVNGYGIPLDVELVTW